MLKAAQFQHPGEKRWRTEMPLPSTTLSAFSDELAALIAQTAPAVVGVQSGRFAASGIHWQSGFVVTTIDAVRCQEDMTLISEDSTPIPATVIGQDPGTDIAVLRVDALDLPTAELGEGTASRVGQLIIALGRSDEGHPRASSGILSSVGGAWQSWTGGHIDSLIRPDIAPFPGFSGSPLLDVQGRVLGLNTTYSRGRFAITIPLPTVNRVVDQLVRRGRIARGYLGIGLQPVELTASLRQALDLSQETGILIVSLEPEGPAEQAGVLIGDILLTLSGEAIASIRDLRSHLSPERVGQAVLAQLIRGGELIELTLTVGER